VSLTYDGRRIRSLNRLKYGCSLDAILPCKRWDCMWVEGCRDDPDIKKHGWPAYGDECLLERRDYEASLIVRRRIHAYAREWLSDAEFEVVLERFAILDLRSRRIQSRLTDEGLVAYIPLPDGSVLHREPIASKRYLASVQRQQRKLLEALEKPPDGWSDDNTHPGEDA